MRILLVEDDDRVVDALSPALRRVGMVVERAASGGEALALLETADLVLLDMGLPDRDGTAVARQIRERGSVPIIAVTARRDEGSIVGALRAGVDDYVTKPYRLAELLARIEAVMRRYGHQDLADVIEMGPLRVDVAAHQAYVDDLPVALAPKELELLAFLLRQHGGVVSRESIMEAIWQTSWIGGSRTVDVHVANLRAKLGRPELIETVRGSGYRIATPSAAGSRSE